MELLPLTHSLVVDGGLVGLKRVVVLAVMLGNQLVRPLLVLALGVEKVSQGDLSPNLELTQDDELAGLTRSFASMTQQLAQARVAEQKTERVKAWNEVAQRVALTAPVAYGAGPFERVV